MRSIWKTAMTVVALSAASWNVQAQTVSVTDMAKRSVSVPATVNRIVALGPGALRLMTYLQATDRVVGVEDLEKGSPAGRPYALAHPELARLPRASKGGSAEINKKPVLEAPAVQSGANTNLEQIIDLAPQVLLMSTMAQSKEQVATLEAAGIQVVVSDADDIEGVYTAISMIGTLMGKADQAQALIDSMKASFLSVSAKADEWAGKSIYFEVSPLEWGLWTAGSATFMDEIARMIGLDNIFADVEGWAEVSEEQVLARDPDYILTISMYFGEGPKPVEEILGRTGWENVSAVKNMALLNLPNDELSRPGPRLAEGAEILFDFILETEAVLNPAS